MNKSIPPIQDLIDTAKKAADFFHELSNIQGLKNIPATEAYQIYLELSLAIKRMELSQEMQRNDDKISDAK